MFGYFKFNERYSTYEMQNAYKNYYCGTCFALQFHYGQLSRFLLSYDITLFAIIMKLHQHPDCDRLKCYGQSKCKKELFLSEGWKKIAALNILLAAEKMRDDIEDSKSFKALVAQVFLGGLFKKARRDFPELSECIRNGYKKILDYEKSNRSLPELAACFAEMMVNTADIAFTVDESQRLFIHEISRWLYVIDALDDYDKDAKKKEFNPVVQPGKTFREYVNENFHYLKLLIENLSTHYPALTKKYENGSVEEQIMCSVLNDTIPTNTSLILNEVKAKIRLKKLGSVWRKVL